MVKFINRIIFLVNIGWLSLAHAQETKITPVSPEAASIAKYINFPVDYSTGVPNISIPLYEIHSGEISLPITLSYHAGGLKANEKSTWVGLGWSLSEAPEISRTINSMPDETSGYLSATYNQYGQYFDPALPYSDIYLEQNIINGGVDRDPDEFYYHLANRGGKFYFANTVPVVGFKAMPVPYSPINIQMFQGNSGLATITDDDGTFYRFGTSLTGADATEISLDANAITSWKCTEIISASKKDTVFITYAPPVNISDVGFNERYEIYDNFQPGFALSARLNALFFSYHPNLTNGANLYSTVSPFLGGTPRVFNYSSNSTNGLYFARPDNNGNAVFYKDLFLSALPGASAITQPQNKTIKISTINYRSGSVKFFQHSHIINGVSSTTNNLDSIQVADYTGKLIKSVQFYFHNCYNSPIVESNHADFMTMLDSVIIRDNTGKKVERYAFDYNSGFGMQYGIKRSDPWGYYNGDNSLYMTANDNAVPLQIVPTTNAAYSTNNTTLNMPAYQLPLTIGSPNFGVNAASQAWILKKIHYPTGGRAEFTYEQNQIATGLAGGLRIQSIKYFADNGSAETLEKHYKYGENENGYGFFKAPNYLSNYSYQQTVYYLNPTFPNIDNTEGEPAVVEVDGTYATERKTTYLTQSMQQMSFSVGSPVVYDRVTEYQVDNGLQTGKTVYQYNYNAAVTNYTPLLGNISKQFDDWPWGQLTGTTYYAYANGNYFWIKKDSINYVSYTRPEPVIVLKAFDSNTYQLGANATIADELQYDAASMQRYSYSLTSGIMLPSQETSAIRDINDTTHVVQTTKNYFYDNKSSPFATRVAFTDSQGNIKTEYTTHPNDYASGDPAMGPLVAANMLTTEVEKVTTLMKTGATAPVIINGMLNTYATDGTGYKLTEQKIEPVVPVALSAFKFSTGPVGALPENTIGQYNFAPYGSYVTKNAYAYDLRGNITQTTANGVANTAFIWDYNNLYPSAAVKNAAISQIAYTSFESNGTGNWSYSPENIINTDGRTGAKCYLLAASNPITKSGLTSANTYIVSYWSKNSTPFTIAGTVGSAVAGTTVPSANGSDTWHYFTHQVTGQTSISITGNGYIDEVRLYPSDAEMTTYTYDPAFGLTAATDAKGASTFYVYDAFGRLSLIKDFSGNIIKQYKYHYTYEQGQ